MPDITQTLTKCAAEQFMRSIHPFLPTFTPTVVNYDPAAGWVCITAPKAVWDLWVN